MNEWMDEFFWWKVYLFFEGILYVNLLDLVDVLRIGKIGVILLDLFVYMKRKDLFNYIIIWYIVIEIINKKLIYGIELRGILIKLVKKFENFILDRNLEGNFFDDKNEKDENEEENEVSMVRDVKLFLILI